jgi:hypothetical protein
VISAFLYYYINKKKIIAAEVVEEICENDTYIWGVDYGDKLSESLDYLDNHNKSNELNKPQTYALVPIINKLHEEIDAYNLELEMESRAKYH